MAAPLATDATGRLLPPQLPPARLFVDGRWRDGAGLDEVPNPATGQLLGKAPVGAVPDAVDAVAAARRAFDEGPWPQLRPRDRAARLAAFADALQRRAPNLVSLVVAEAGSTIGAALSHQVTLPLQHLEWWVEQAGRDRTEAVPPWVSVRSDGSSWLGSSVVRHPPVGVVAAVTPFNFPFFLNVWKVGPALAAGNTVVLKPSPFTPFSALVLAEAAEEAELPAGVLNVVTGGPDVGRHLTTDPAVDMVTFTGSDVVGAAIMGQAAPTLKRVLLELGGKSALIVRADADLDLAAATGAHHLTFQAGQGCALCTRHLVHASVLREYTERLVARLRAVVVGDPADPATGMGPLIRPAAQERVQRYVDAAWDRGADVLTGGRAAAGGGGGWFYEPTLLGGLDNSWPVAREEIFGPVGVVIPVADDDEAVRVANDSPYGLSGAVFSADAGAAYELACRLRTGEVNLNGGAGVMSPEAPFGGFKRSGLGRELGEAGLLEYCQTQTIKFQAG
ncbi:MAG: aldehyde dehydrogenase [Actinomycetota bacterium]|nr:aldehyde dehydrogenase [Actinomycetota bacterium]